LGRIAVMLSLSGMAYCDRTGNRLVFMLKIPWQRDRFRGRQVLAWVQLSMYKRALTSTCAAVFPGA
jgi:hypothetical protein